MGMSHFKGRLIEVTYPNCNSVAMISKAIFKDIYKPHFFKALDGRTIWEELLIENYGNEYIILNNKVYKLSYEAVYGDETIAIINSNGIIDFNIRYSNGGADFIDVLKRAVKDATVIKSSDDVLADIRNKMGPVAHFISLMGLIHDNNENKVLDEAEIEYINKSIPKAYKKSVEALDWLRDNKNF